MCQLRADIQELVIRPLGRDFDAGLVKHGLVDHHAILVELAGDAEGLAVDIIVFGQITEVLRQVKSIALAKLRQVERHVALGTLGQLRHRVGHVDVDLVAAEKVGLQLDVAGVVVDETLVLNLNALVLVRFVERVTGCLRAALCGDAAPHTDSNDIAGLGGIAGLRGLAACVRSRRIGLAARREHAYKHAQAKQQRKNSALFHVLFSFQMLSEIFSLNCTYFPKNT